MLFWGDNLMYKLMILRQKNLPRNVMCLLRIKKVPTFIRYTTTVYIGVHYLLVSGHNFVVFIQQ